MKNAFDYLAIKNVITRDPKILADVDKIILPGVGAFGAAMESLNQFELTDILNSHVQSGKPIMGVCLGMQLLAQKSFEHSEQLGMGWISGEILPIRPNDSALKIPHIGWNITDLDCDSSLFKGLGPVGDFYYVHGYAMQCAAALVTAKCDYGGPITAAIEFKNIFGTQFHPEKSQNAGLAILTNFANL